MNNANMAGMNAMGGPVGAGMPMMNNGTGGPVRPAIANDSQRSQLNTYIYEYFLANRMYDCARSLLNSEQLVNVAKNSPGRENGADEGDDSKDMSDPKRPDDLPAPLLPKECTDSCFLYEWWCLFWDMFNAQRGKGDRNGSVHQYVAHTQNISKQRQDQQQNMLRNMRGPEGMSQYNQMMMRNQVNGGMPMHQNEIARKAMMQNSGRNVTPQQMQMMQQQQKQQQMQRGPSDGEHPRPQSPAGAENAPSPSKRPRIEGAQFNGQGVMPNGRPGPGPGQQPFPNFPAGTNPQKIAAYQATLSQQQQKQMPGAITAPGAPQGAGSPPMMSQAQEAQSIPGYYSMGDIPNAAVRAQAAGPGVGNGANHALQDYQMQLMLLEQQNKRRLMMARQEADVASPMLDGQPRPPGPPGPPGNPMAMGPNGQQMQGASPQGARNSPNPNEQMKRGTPHMMPAGIPSPIPEGQSRASPGPMNFNVAGGQMDPNMNQQFFNKMNGMEGGMPGANGMRPPSSHPGGFNGQMPTQAQQQQMMARQQQQGQQPGAPQQMGTPQQRAMPPPSAPAAAAAAAAAANGRTQTSSPQPNPAPPTPQQANKANPKKKADAKKEPPKRPVKKGSSNALGAATPSADNQEPATPTPATPITPQHAKGFPGQNGVAAAAPNGQPGAPNAAQAPQQADPISSFSMDGSFDIQNFEFANPSNANGMDVLQDFDFDSFLHNDEGAGDFGFDPTTFPDLEMAAE